MLIPENTGDRVFSVRKTRVPTVREKRYKVFQELNISYVSISLIDCQSNTFLLMNIIILYISKLAIRTPEQSFLLLTLIKFQTSFGGLK